MTVLADRTLAEAIPLLDRGVALLPVKGKVPHHEVMVSTYGETSWRRLADRRACRAEVEAWLAADPSCGIGVICGEASGGLAVIDVDVPRAIRRLAHPPTPTVRSGGGGTHLYVSGLTATRKLDGLGDLKGEGGYVVAPLSPHPSGTTYEWIDALRFDEVGLASLSEVRGLGGKNGGPKVEVPLPRALVSPEALHEIDPGFFATSAAAVERVLPVLGIPVEAIAGRKFSCPMPRHGDRHPSATISRGSDGVFRVRCWAGCVGEKTLTLADIAASRGAGDLRRLDAPSQLRWYRRLEVEAGLIAADRPRLPPLPDDAIEAVRRVYDGFRLLVAVRRSLGDDGPTPFTSEFAAAWCGLSPKQAKTALSKLSALDRIRPVGNHGLLLLWIPGTGDIRRIAKAAAAREAKRRSS